MPKTRWFRSIQLSYPPSVHESIIYRMSPTIYRMDPIILWFRIVSTFLGLEFFLEKLLFGENRTIFNVNFYLISRTARHWSIWDGSNTPSNIFTIQTCQKQQRLDDYFTVTIVIKDDTFASSLYERWRCQSVHAKRSHYFRWR